MTHKIETITNEAAEEDFFGRAASLNEQVEVLFDVARINLEDSAPLFGIADEETGLFLAAVLTVRAPYRGDPYDAMWFSVAVGGRHRRKGYARALILAFLDWCESKGYPPGAYVVNKRAMEPLLTDLGFVQKSLAWPKIWDYQTERDDQ